MSEFLTFLESAARLAIEYPAAVSFFGALIAGESILIILGALSGQGLLSFWVLFVFSLLGAVSSDLFLYVLGRNLPLRNLKKMHLVPGTLKGAIARLNKIAYRNQGKAIVISKMIYGTRTATMVYLGHTKMPLLKFLVYTSASTFVLLWIVLGLGWLAGRGMGDLFELFKSIRLAITFIAGLIILLIIFRASLNQVLKYSKI